MNDRNRVNKLAADRTHLDRLQGQNEWLKCAEDLTKRLRETTMIIILY